MEEMKMVKLFTHTDLDGVSCAILAKIAFGEDIDIEYVNYNDVNEKISYFLHNTYLLNYERVFITDISVNEEISELINNAYNNYYKNIKLLDHHKTAESMNKYDWAEVITETSETRKESGTSLFYNFLSEIIKINCKLDTFTEIERKYDTWEWVKRKNQKAKDLNDILYLIGRDEFIEYYSKYLSKNPENFEINSFHLELLKYKRKEIENYIENKLNKVFLKNRIAYIVADIAISELGMKAMEKHDNEIDFVAIYTGFNVSLRSKGDFDVSEIAKKFGGGGHKNAAGFTIDYTEKLFNIFE
jgi:uncharacterized protein